MAQIGLEPSAYAPFADPEDFIVGCTAHIWDQRAVGTIGTRYYAPDATVHGASGDVCGADTVERGTLAALAAYPDEVARAEDVIWEQRGGAAFVSSHRVLSSATNLGHSEYGPPTRRRYLKRAIAHCRVREGRIVEEWVVRDEVRLVTDLGLPLRRVVRMLAEQDAAPWTLEVPADAHRCGVSGDRPGTELPDGPEVAVVRALVDEVWNGRDHSVLADLMTDQVAVETSRGRTVLGVRENSAEILALLSALPDAQLRVLDVAANTAAGRGTRVAVIWLLEGTYDGAELFGPRTGRPLRLLGGSHFGFRAGKIDHEYRVYDELAARVAVARTHRRVAGA